MAKKKIPTVEDAVKALKDILDRAFVDSYRSVNNIMLFEDKNGMSILVVPDQTLATEVFKGEEIPGAELDLSNPSDVEHQWKFQYAEDLVENWVAIEATEDLFNGKLFKITVRDTEYRITINKELMPLKLKKAEYKDISYRTFGTRSRNMESYIEKTPLILAIKKRFDSPVEDCGFTLIRLFQIV